MFERIFEGRDGEIRTRDPFNPIEVRYLAALRPELASLSLKKNR